MFNQISLAFIFLQHSENLKNWTDRDVINTMHKMYTDKKKNIYRSEL